LLACLLTCPPRARRKRHQQATLFSLQSISSHTRPVKNRLAVCCAVLVNMDMDMDKGHELGANLAVGLSMALEGFAPWFFRLRTSGELWEFWKLALVARPINNACSFSSEGTETRFLFRHVPTPWDLHLHGPPARSYAQTTGTEASKRSKDKTRDEGTCGTGRERSAGRLSGVGIVAWGHCIHIETWICMEKKKKTGTKILV